MVKGKGIAMNKGIKRCLIVLSMLFILTMTCPAFGQSGKYKSVAINTYGYVLEVHSASHTDDMWYNLGYWHWNSSSPSLTWVYNGRVEHGYTASKSWSRVIINDNQEVAVFFPGHDVNEKSWVVTGKIITDPNEWISAADYSVHKPLHVEWNKSRELTELYDYMGDDGTSLHAQFSDDGTQVHLRWVTSDGFFYTSYSYDMLKNGNLNPYKPWQVKTGCAELKGNTGGIAGYDGECWYVGYQDADKNNINIITVYDPANNWKNTDLAELAGGNYAQHAMAPRAETSPNNQYSIVVVPNHSKSEMTTIGQELESHMGKGKYGVYEAAVGGLLTLLSGLIGDGDYFGYIGKEGTGAPATGSVGNGELPVVAINKNGFVVAIHTDSRITSYELWCHAGVLTGSQMTWGESQGL